MDITNIPKITGISDQISEAEEAVARTEAESPGGISETVDIVQSFSQLQGSQDTNSIFGIVSAADFRNDAIDMSELERAGGYPQVETPVSQPNAALGMTTDWDNAEVRIHNLESQLQLINSPQSASLQQQLHQLELDLQQERSNVFQFEPSEDIMNRLTTLANQANDLVHQFQTSQAQQAPIDQAPPQPDSQPAIAAQPGMDQIAYPPPPQTWDQLENGIRFLENQIATIHTTDAQQLRQQLEQLELRVQDERSNVFAFTPGESTINDYQMLENQTKTLVSTQAM